MYGYELETYKQTKKLMDALTRLLALSSKACFPEKILINWTTSRFEADLYPLKELKHNVSHFAYCLGEQYFRASSTQDYELGLISNAAVSVAEACDKIEWRYTINLDELLRTEFAQLAEYSYIYLPAKATIIRLMNVLELEMTAASAARKEE